MKILVSCIECKSSEEENTAAVLEVSNDSVYKVVCDNGHVQNVSIPLQQHEILFEIGAYAIVDGYCREAISSFSAALERYYEFFIRVIFADRASPELEKVWKLVSSQSERQLGGYIFSYFFVYGSSPLLLDRKSIELRNNVVHKGYIPKRKESVDFGQSVAKLINAGCGRLKMTDNDKVQEMIRRTLYPSGSAFDNRVHIPASYLSLLAGESRGTLDEHLANIATHNMPRFER